MSLPAVLIRKSTGEIIKRDIYPREDLEPVVGLDPDLEWLLEYIPFNTPDYDSRIFILNTTEEVTTTPHPDYSHLNQFLITYATEKRANEDIEIAVENAERNSNENIFPYTKQLKLLTLGLAVLFRRVEGMTLGAPEQAVADEVMALGLRLWRNDQILRDKIQEIADGLEPNIDSGWESVS